MWPSQIYRSCPRHGFVNSLLSFACEPPTPFPLRGLVIISGNILALFFALWSRQPAFILRLWCQCPDFCRQPRQPARFYALQFQRRVRCHISQQYPLFAAQTYVISAPPPATAAGRRCFLRIHVTVARTVPAYAIGSVYAAKRPSR